MVDQDPNSDEDSADGIDDRQMILPYINTQTKMLPGLRGQESKTIREGIVYVPAGVALIGAGLGLLYGMYLVVAIFAVLLLPLLGIGIYLDIRMSQAWYLTPDGMMKEYVSYRFLRQSLPWGFQETVENTHNIRCFHDDENE